MVGALHNYNFDSISRMEGKRKFHRESSDIQDTQCLLHAGLGVRTHRENKFGQVYKDKRKQEHLDDKIKR